MSIPVSARRPVEEDGIRAVAGLKECIRLKNLVRGKQIHVQAIETGLLSNQYVANTLINMYAKCGSITDAQNTFDSLVKRDSVSWNFLIQAYVDNGDPQTALQKFGAMHDDAVNPDARTYVSALSACAALAEQQRRQPLKTGSNWLEEGMVIHSQAVMNRCCNAFVESMLVTMYSKCGSMFHARNVFNSMHQVDVVAWNALLQGYVENGESQHALELFENSQRGLVPNARTYIAALKACTALAGERPGRSAEIVDKGRRVHSRAVKDGCYTIFVESTLIEMYSKCGCMADARLVFEKMRRRDVISWNCLVQGYVENRDYETALEVVGEMHSAGVKPSSTTFIFALAACGNLMAVECGRRFHAEIWKAGLEKQLATCLVDFYGKCGSMEDAKQVFDSIVVKDLTAWNALMYGYSQQGDTRQVLALFEEMQKRGILPDKISFTHILTACSHAGLSDQGNDYFCEMSRRFVVKPDLIHYTCLVDLSARANRLKQALEIVRSMPYEADVVVWTAILGACWKWKNTEVGMLAYEKLMDFKEREVDVSAAYVLMANILALNRQSVISRGPSRTCWIDGTGFVHKFVG